MLESITYKQWFDWQHMMSKFSYMFDGGNSLNALNISSFVNVMGNKTKPADFFMEMKEAMDDESIENRIKVL